MTAGHMHVAVALDGTGFHPASWRDASARPAEIFSASYWASLGVTAERGFLDFVTIEDSLGLQSSSATGPDGRVDRVRGRLDAALIASLIAPHTRHIGLVPTAIPTHTEPFHLASALSTLDFISGGRAGWRPQISARPSDAAHFGRRPMPVVDPAWADGAASSAFVADLFDEAADAVEVVRRLWDSWEDDAVIRDAPTGRFVDRDKLHYIDFQGRFFSVKGPSIVPRPPQGNPPIAALAHSRIPFEFAARSADVVFVTPRHDQDVADRVADVRLAEQAVGRTMEPLRVYADIEVYLDDTTKQAQDRKQRLDDLDGARHSSDAAWFMGTVHELADQLQAWQLGGVDGFRLRPGVIGHDLDAIVDGLVPVLQQRDVFRTRYGDTSLRQRLGLPVAINRYESVSEGPSR
jgi:alkanesulfonate monooxygenase SsuD/methylene tetrahydromethanopterin reductase-like flavin-dependent oxidoreductase (luciferase family)